LFQGEGRQSPETEEREAELVSILLELFIFVADAVAK
jgi:hypothetical protein